MAIKPVDKIPSGQQSVEDNYDDKRPVNNPGVWTHSGSGAVLEALSQPAADAFARMGFRPATDTEVTEYRKRVSDAEKEKLDVFIAQQEKK